MAILSKVLGHSGSICLLSGDIQDYVTEPDISGMLDAPFFIPAGGWCSYVWSDGSGTSKMEKHFPRGTF